MSATNFYQTLYQTDQLFRLANDTWDPVDNVADVAVLDEPNSPETTKSDRSDADFLTALDELANPAPPSVVTLVDEPVDPPVLVVAVAEPEPTAVIVSPEPLPEPAPRPTTPSILPPVQQQSRLPQLNHKVLLLADEELDPSNLLFLEKILKAVNLNINGVDLLNLHGVQDMDFAELLRGKYINHFITFGVPFERINLDIMMDRYAPVRFEGITFLLADTLQTI